jgi:hypothetical protein
MNILFHLTHPPFSILPISHDFSTLLSPPLLLIHGIEKITITLGGMHLLEKKLHAFPRIHGLKDFSQKPDSIQVVGIEKELFLARSRPLNVDRGEDPPVNEASIEMDFHVTCSFELLENHFVHSAACVDERRGNDGQASTFLDVARGTEEPFGALQRIGVNAA